MTNCFFTKVSHGFYVQYVKDHDWFSFKVSKF